MKSVMPELITVEELAFALKKTVKVSAVMQREIQNVFHQDAVFPVINVFSGVERMLRTG